MRPVLAAALLPLAVACMRMVPPPPAPPPAVPAPREAPPPEGTGRVYLDVLEGPADVRLVAETSLEVTVVNGTVAAGALRTEPGCTTPCVLDLPFGRRTLTFPVLGARGRVELADVVLGDRPVVYRRTLGRQRQPGAGLPLGIVATAFGGMSFVTGAALLPVGLATDTDGLSLAGGITLAAGAALTAVGILAIAHSPTVLQPGAGAQYMLP